MNRSRSPRRPIQSQSGLVGIRNVTGSQCFLNSALQSLMNHPIFSEWLINQEFDDSQTLLETLQVLKNQMIRPSRIGIDIRSSGILDNISDILSPYGVDVCRQDDANLTIMAIVDRIIEEEPELSDMFNIIMKVTRECTNCGYVSTENETRIDIPLTWMTDSQVPIEISIDDALDQYLEPHIIPNTCPSCHLQNVMEESREILELSHVLIISLRPRHDRMGSRINDVLRFPGRMMMDTEEIFDIASVIDHVGSMTGGHYNIKIFKNGTWWRIDDSVVYPASRGSVIQPSNYMLFYTKIE